MIADDDGNFSDEIVSVEAQIERLVKQHHASPDIHDWLRAHLPVALSWLTAHRDAGAETTTSIVALVENVFSLTFDAQSLDEFRVGLFRGLLPYTAAESRRQLAQEAREIF